MSELSPSSGSEGYGICADAVDMGNDRKITNLRLISHAVKTSVGKSAALNYFPLLLVRLRRLPLMRSPVVWMICSRDW